MFYNDYDDVTLSSDLTVGGIGFVVSHHMPIFIGTLGSGFVVLEK